MFAALGMDVGADTFDLSFHEPPLSERSGQPMLLGMGDPVAGPLLGLFYDAPSTPEQLAGPPDLAPAHSHSCDNFRICMKGELIVGQERYHHGEFRLQQSGCPYGQDGDAPHVDGNWRIIFFADRRGHLVRPTNPEIPARVPGRGVVDQRAYGDLLPELLDDDDGGVVGMVTNLTTPLSKLGHIDGSFRDAAQWDTLGASKVAASLLGLPDLGPVVMLLQHPRGADRGAGVHVRHRRLPARRRRVVLPRRPRAHHGRHAFPVAGHAVGAGHRRPRRARRGRHPRRPAGRVAHRAGRPERGGMGARRRRPAPRLARKLRDLADARSSTSADRLTLPAALRGTRSTAS